MQAVHMKGTKGACDLRPADFAALDAVWKSWVFHAWQRQLISQASCNDRALTLVVTKFKRTMLVEPAVTAMCGHAHILLKLTCAHPQLAVCWSKLHKTRLVVYLLLLHSTSLSVSMSPLLDVKVSNARAWDCLGHSGLAELSLGKCSVRGN